MKKILLCIALLTLTILANAQNSGSVLIAQKMSMTDLSGANPVIYKMAIGTVTPSTGNGYSINISGCGFSTVVGCQIIPIKSTTVATSSPKISIKSISTSSIVVNIIEGNSSTVNLLGSLVLLGTSEQFADVTGMTLSVIVFGN